MVSKERDFHRRREHLGLVVGIMAPMGARLSESFSNENRNLSPGRKPSQTALGTATFVLGLDYYTYKQCASTLSIARNMGEDTQAIEAVLANPASWAITMKGGGINNDPETEVSFKSFIEEPTGSRHDSLASPEKLASYVSFFGDVIMIGPIR